MGERSSEGLNMSENLTISQLAKKLNISRQKIYRFLEKPEHSSIHQSIYTDSKNIKMINCEGIKYIEENIGRTKDRQVSDNNRTRGKHESGYNAKNSSYDEHVTYQENAKGNIGRTTDGQFSDNNRTNFFIKQIEQKDGQIHTLQKIIEKNQNLLDQQQRLALQDKKLLEEYKAENERLKAFRLSHNDNKAEEIVNQFQEEKSIKVSKKWYHFWK